MKKYLISFIALFYFATVIKADGLIVADVGILQGMSTSVQVALSNSGESYRAVLFTLSLPDGISIVTDEYGDPVTEPNTNLQAVGYEVTANKISDGCYRFGVMKTTGNEVIPEECGPLFSFSIEADESLMVGSTLTGILSDIKLTDAWAVDHSSEDVTFIIDVEESRIILDENSVTVPTAANDANVRVLRTINANAWSTICLPFAMTEAQVNTVFGDDVQLADFTGYVATYDDNNNVVGITIYFNDVTSIEANHPYLIKVQQAMADFTVDGVNINVEDEPVVSFGYTTGRGQNKVYHPIDFVGTYVADFDFFNDAYSHKPLFLSGNVIYYATADTQHMKAFRAYFDFDDVLSDMGTSASRITMSFNDDSTGITDWGEDSHDVETYNLHGLRVSTPKKGLYIREGKKVIIK